MTNCLQCGKEIELINKGSKYKKFCNRSCSGTYNNLRREVNPEWWDDLRNKSKKDLNCVECGVHIVTTSKKQKYCSSECRSVGRERKIKLRFPNSVGIIAEPPFYKMRYYTSIVAKDGRKKIFLYHIEKYKFITSMLYSRYLMSVKLGRVLDKTEQVDHINNNPLDDRIENLQILSGSDNMKKYATEVSKGQTMVELICPCGTKFTRVKRNTFLTKSRNAINTFCSRKCPSSHIGFCETKTIFVREFKEFQ